VPFTGNLLAESLRKDAPLEAVPLAVRKIWRADAGDPAADQPLTWTFIEFEIPDDSVDALAAALARGLQPGPWYCDFRSEQETFVVFANRIFRYPRGDQSAREEAEGYARSVGVPETQVDWRV
jgi:hypothetical protein